MNAGERAGVTAADVPVDVEGQPVVGVTVPTLAAPSSAHEPWIRVLALDAAVLVGLAGVAITQPLLELLGDNPTFFVAGRYEPHQIVALALTVAFVPPVLVFLATVVPGLAARRLSRPAHGVGVGALAALLALMLCRTARIDGVVYVVPAAVLAGAAVAVAEWRSALFRRFLGYLAAGNVAFVALFLVASPVADLVRRPAVGGQEGAVVVPALAGPVLLIVLDEMPVTTLMRADGTINDTRYPNFARLAEHSTWFRNAASESRTTFVSTPSILSGRRAGDHDLPILEEHPRNLFTLFGDRYPVSRYEIVTDMCPPDVCEPPPAGSFRGLLDDVALVYQHRVLPPDWRTGLPTIEAGWGDFGASTAGEPGPVVPETPSTTTERNPMARVDEFTKEERSRPGQMAALRQVVAGIDADPSVNVVHVVLPHHPYVLTPWGEGAMTHTWMPDEVAEGSNMLPPVDDPGYEFAFQQVYPLQSMQIGAVDTVIGETIDHLEATGAWDDALVVVTSDHGIDTTAPGFGRYEDDTNTDELFRIPLFVKAPGQTTGQIDDAPASTVDILPTIVDLLGIETDWRFEGHSLVDGSEPTIDRYVTTDVDAAIAIAAAHAARYPRGEGWADLAAVGVAEDLVGTDVGDHTVGAPSPMRWATEHDDVLADLSIADGPVPYLLRARVTGTGERPPDLVVSVNGTVAGAVGAFRHEDDAWLMSGVMAPLFADGRNEVVAYEVVREGGTVTLHPLVA